MGNTTKVIPTTSNTQQEVKLPDYIVNAGTAATQKAQDFASTPYQSFSGQLVAPLTANQGGAVNMASKAAGQGSQEMAAAQGFLRQAGGAAAGAGQVARNSVGVGLPNLNNANVAGGYADSLARLGVTAGQPSINAGAGAANDAVGAARANIGAGAGNTNYAAALARMAGRGAANDTNAGVDQVNQGSALASLAGRSAAGSQDVVGGDLGTARGYNASSAGPVSTDDISRYFNPFVQQALDPVISNLTRASGQNDALLRSKAGMSGAFGGSRGTLQQTENQANLLRQIATTTGQGYSDAYTSALGAAQADKARQGQAAGTAINIGNLADSGATSALARLTSAADASNRSGQARSDLATASLGRLSSAADAASRTGQAQSDIATASGNRLTAAASSALGAGQAQSGQVNDALSRLIQSSNNQSGLATTASNLSSADLDRLISSVNPNIALAGAEGTAAQQGSQLSTDAINRMLTTGALEQTQQQNIDNSNYQQFQNQQNYSLTQLNALIAAAGGVPYGTSTTSNNQGTQVVSSPSAMGQVLGAATSLGAAALMSDRDAKTDFKPVEDSDVLAKFRNLTVERYRYKPEVRGKIGDDGRERIGPMAQDWAEQFGGNGKMIPMPQIIGELVSAVRALDKRTASPARKKGALAA